ncbi:MAG: hypothetical protein B7Z74_04860 [Deltaproteobacteria bacterium 21-66-5]|nr:MAG: hypothetical protein B7Z74_04860 [Deltaproteobacteria bacterium 21-66-5]
MPHWIEQFDLSGFDLVVSSSHCVAKGVRKSPDAVHVSFIHAPMRYMWDRFDDYFGKGRASLPVRLAAHAMTGSGRYADAAIRAGRFLSRCQDRDGIWRRGTSSYAARGELLYNARTAWALAEAGVRLGLPGALRTARRALEAVALRQHPNGWIPECSLDDPAHPLLHTLAYAIRGLLEGGRVLGDDSLIAHAERAAAAVAAQLRADGFLAGRFAADWAPAVTWSCLTGNAQMANVWFRLSAITGDARWIEPARRTLRFVAATQNRTSGDGGLRGGIKGSAPMSGAYGRYETLSWATKFFVDAILRDEQSRGRLPVACAAADLA